MLRQELPGGAHFVEEVLYVLAYRTLIFFISLGKDQAEGDRPVSEPLYKFQVDLLRAMPAVYQDEHRYEIFPFTQVVFDHLLPSSSLGDGDFCKAIAWKVDDIPFLIDGKMIDQLGLAGGAGGFCQFLVPNDHIDQGGLANIAPADEGIFGPVGRRALRVVRAADDIGGGVDVHVKY